jgi:SAM-dependent methyltransferase
VGFTSLVAWLMPALALWGAVAGLGPAISPGQAAEVFSVGTLLGGAALLPLGTGVAGSSMILQLDALGLPSQISVVVVGLLRLGTTWYALALGLLAFVRWRGPILSVARQPVAQDHFDDLADEYAEEIPAAVRDRLVGRKVEVMADWLSKLGVEPPARGLEFGCGQGWYTAEMARLGYDMSACDRSTGQVAQARRFLAGQGLEIPVSTADVQWLPYPDGHFDFAYGVNVIHHVVDPGGWARALAEVARVLKPGGSFFLQEINTENPLFAFYMGYVFPLIRRIDDGTEAWIKPSTLPPVQGARWDDECAFLTFLPDFTPAPLVRGLGGLERALEHSPIRSWSAHFVARLVKDEA